MMTMIQLYEKGRDERGKNVNVASRRRKKGRKEERKLTNEISK